MERLGGGNLLGCQSSAKHRRNDSKFTVCKVVQGWDVNMACSCLVVQHGKQPIEIVKIAKLLGFRLAQTDIFESFHI